MAHKINSFADTETEVWYINKELKAIKEQALKNEAELKEIKKKLKEEGKMDRSDTVAVIWFGSMMFIIISPLPLMAMWFVLKMFGIVL